MKHFAVLALIAIPVLASFISSAYAIQLGPKIVVHPDRICVGGACAGPGGVKVPTMDQVIETVINSNPATVVLSDADKRKLHDFLKTSSFVASFFADPLGTIVILKIITPDGKEEQVPVPTTNAPPSGNSYSFTASCLLAYPDNLFNAQFTGDPPGLEAVVAGDQLTVTAPICSVYDERSVTSATIKVTGRSDYPKKPPTDIRHYIIGNGI